MQRELRRRRARRAGRPRARGARRARVRSDSSKNSSRALPCSLAWYIAASASRSSSSAVVVRAVGDRDPEAGAEEALAAVEHERALELGGDAVGDPAHVGEARDALEQDHELVAAEAGDHVVGAQLGRQALGDGDQQLVAGAVAERVVDDLEVVDVGEQDREPACWSRGGARAPRPACGRTARGSAARSAGRGAPGGRAARRRACGR